MSRFSVDPPRAAGPLLAELGVAVKWLGGSPAPISFVAPLEEVENGGLAFCSGIRAKGAVNRHCVAGSILLVEPASVEEFAGLNITLGIVERPREAFAICLAHLFPDWNSEAWATAPFMYPRAQVANNVALSSDAVLGDGTRLHPGVVIHGKVRIGRDALVQAGSILGAFGMSFARRPDGKNIPFPQLAGVRVGDEVSIGAECVVHRGTLNDTLIGSGTAIGALASIGHNVKIGDSCFLGPRTVISGGARIGDGCWIGPGAVIGDYVTLANSARVAPGAVVTRDVAASQLVVGNPARVVARKDVS